MKNGLEISESQRDVICRRLANVAHDTIVELDGDCDDTRLISRAFIRASMRVSEKFREIKKELLDGTEYKYVICGINITHIVCSAFVGRAMGYRIGEYHPESKIGFILAAAGNAMSSIAFLAQAEMRAETDDDYDLAAMVDSFDVLL